MQTVEQHFELVSSVECTLEANPDDLSITKIASLRKLGITRLSIGIQSFHAPHLAYLHRAHTREQAINAVNTARDNGINNISIDLIYAIPSCSHQVWEDDLSTALMLNIEHISAYALTIEKKTVFGKWLAKGNIKPIDNDFAAQQFEMMVTKLARAGFQQYEIANFARHKHYGKHNSNYWKQAFYLGIGPSAHSYNGISRQYNVANNAAYLHSINSNKVPYTLEILHEIEQINEYLLTSLRTMWGSDLNYIRDTYKVDLDVCRKDMLTNYENNGMLVREGSKLFLTQKGKLFR